MDSSPLQPGGDNTMIPPVGCERTASQKIHQCHRPKFGRLRVWSSRTHGKHGVIFFRYLTRKNVNTTSSGKKSLCIEIIPHDIIWHILVGYSHQTSDFVGRSHHSQDWKYSMYLKVNLVLIVDSRISGCQWLLRRRPVSPWEIFAYKRFLTIILSPDWGNILWRPM